MLSDATSDPNDAAAIVVCACLVFARHTNLQNSACHTDDSGIACMPFRFAGDFVSYCLQQKVKFFKCIILSQTS